MKDKEMLQVKRSSMTAGIVLAVMFFCGTASADYRFDDLGGASGISFQWMVLNTAGQTFGGSHSEPIDIRGRLVLDTNADLEVLSGSSTTPLTNRELSAMFWVVAMETGPGRFTMNFGSDEILNNDDVPDPSTPDIGLGTTVYEYSSGTPFTSLYSSYKLSGGQSTGNKDYFTPLWNRYEMSVSKTSGSSSTYDTVRQVINFHLNPNTLPSQTINRPIIIANVAKGTAEDAPLELRMTLRENSSAGNIVSFHHDRWSVNSPLSTGSDQWVFVPVDSFSSITTSPKYYFLTTEVANHTSIRYAAQDSYTNNAVYPVEWRFDLPRYQGTTDIRRRFNLDTMSHMAPGLVSVYNRSFNINEQNKRPLRVYAVDDDKRNGIFDLVVNHNVIYGEQLGTKYERRGTSSLNFYEVTAYRPRPYSMDFYKKIAERTRSSSEEVSVPSNLSFGAGSITHEDISMPAKAIRYFTVNQTIPGNYRKSAGADAVLPLHITMNIPVTEIQDRDWYNDMLNEWHTTGNIQNLFRENFDICLMVQTDGKNNPWNMSEELERLRVYEDQVKVFLDEDRGATTQDNTQGVITVSFIVYLMDGTRDNKRPELSVVTDGTASDEHSYIVLRDGTADDKWNMTFFIAPAGDYVNNTYVVKVDSGDNAAGGAGDAGSADSSGCSAGTIGVSGFAVLLYFVRRGR